MKNNGFFTFIDCNIFDTQERLWTLQSSWIAPIYVTLILLCQIMYKLVILAGKRVSSAMDGKFKSIHGAWIPAIQAGMTILENSQHVIRQSRFKIKA